MKISYIDGAEMLLIPGKFSFSRKLYADLKNNRIDLLQKVCKIYLFA